MTAEDAVADAFAAAAADWPRRGVPRRPGAWLTVTARRRAVDRLRRAEVRAGHQSALAHHERLLRAAAADGGGGDPDPGDGAVTDDRLRSSSRAATRRWPPRPGWPSPCGPWAGWACPSWPGRS